MSLRSTVQGWRIRAASWLRGRALHASYAGGSTSRLFMDWVAGILSPDAEIRGNLAIMRARARQLARDNEYIAGFLKEVENNVIGPEGIVLQARVKNAAGVPVKRTNWAIEAAWREWGYPENASIDTRDSWVDLQRQMIRAIACDGEILLRRRPGADNDFGFAVQLIDPDLLDETFDAPPDEDGVEIRMGVEVDTNGRPLAYHLWQRHPSERWRGRGERVRVPASEVRHLFIRHRPGQTRGVTWLAPVLTSVKMLDGYEEAELVAARAQAASFGVIVNKSDAAIQGYNPGPDDASSTIEAAPGVIQELKPGQELQMYEATHPSMAFKEFTKTILRGQARGLGVSYHTLTGDLESVNYSSIRAGLLPERDHWKTLQVWLATHAHRWVYRRWLPSALASGMLRVDRRIATEYYDVEWKGRGWKWVDPLKDLQGEALALQLGLTSRQRIHGAAGSNFEDTIDELAYEQKYASTEGVAIDPPKSQQGEADRPGADEEEDDDERGAEARVLSVVNA